MTYTLPPWNAADEWLKLLDQLREQSGGFSVALHISNSYGETSYSVGEDVEEEDADDEE